MTDAHAGSFSSPACHIYWYFLQLLDFIASGRLILYFPAIYVVPVRQAKGFPAASFRFHLTMDTLAVQLCTSSLPARTRDLHPLERAHGAQTGKSLLWVIVFVASLGPAP